ncbi:Zinc-type alcohol dehydrogenase-like protein PB24D3.08c [Verticillium dahliae VDG1]|nr:Zinc-type alcohol dehydrogenase-like protein PB24D3.08c [Verticillium dahliae VDG1]
MSATRRARPRAPSEDPTDLPPYEPLELTLSDNSFICPLSLQPLTQPFSNNKCSHTFQKESIQAWFAEMRNQERTCPTTGCNVQLKLGDFYDDDLILRKILRQKRRLAAEAAAAEEIDDVSDEDEAPRRRSQAVKKERRGSDDEIEDDS